LGKILEIKNIRDTIKDYDHDEKCDVGIPDITGRI